MSSLRQFMTFQLLSISKNDVYLEVNAFAVRLIPLTYDVFPCMRVAIDGCEDDDECQQQNGNCDHFCHNIPGSFNCSCKTGYDLQKDNRTCRDINECDTNYGGCNNICENKPGSYECKCWTGYKMSADNHTCVDIDECKVNNGGCSHICVNIAGGFKCTCPLGLEVDSETERHCVDTNECLLGNGGCEMYCHNNNGSYTCSCRVGFEQYDTYRCRDIDECARNTDQCDDQSTDCHNYQGGSECRCKRGYTFIPNNNKKCERMVCAPLVQSQGTIVSPQSCLVKDAKRVGDKCSFSCKPGYKLSDPSQDTMTCLDTANWDKFVISCRHKTPPRVVFCPTNIYDVTADLQKVITWQEPVFSDNVKVTAVSSNKKSGQKFYHGNVLVTYSARDAAGNTARCSFDVSLERLECPVPKQPENGRLTRCASFGNTKYCRIICNPGKQLFQFTYGATCLLPTAKWNEIPDCVVKCPRGYKYDFATKDCIKCPIGYTSLAESSTQCTMCPSGKSTAEAGSKNCLDLCKPGTSSRDGFDLPLNAQSCLQCSMGYYSEKYGATQCQQCPDKLTTLSKGAKSKDSCGIAPTVTEFSPTDITVDENDRVEFVCKADGPPTPAINVVKARPAPDNLAGPVKVEPIVSGGKQIGIRYVILRASEHDKGLYSCVAKNDFGQNTKYLHLKVKITVIGSGNGFIKLVIDVHRRL
ncbi:hypothetical protein QZH41_007640 [Actinostola sp. cb2023]|nr:hypothetical protein QZH41_007640 [Actinostola sp. cb2023]